MSQNRWASKVMYASAVAIVLGTLVGIDVITPTTSDKINMVITAILDILGIFGVINNPTAKGRL